MQIDGLDTEIESTQKDKDRILMWWAQRKRNTAEK